MERTEEMTRLSAPAHMIEGSYVDWAAIIAGAVVAVAVSAVFTGFGAALGLSTISTESEGDAFNFTVILSAVWIVVTLVASYMTGGYIAGRMRRRVDGAGADEVTTRDGVNGLVVWGVGMIASVMVLGAAVSTTISAVGAAASVAESAEQMVVDAAGTDGGGAADGDLALAGGPMPETATADPMVYVSDTLLRPGPAVAVTVDAESLGRETTAILANVRRTGEINDSERAYLVSVVAARSGLTAPEAETRVDQAIADAQTMRADAETFAADERSEVERLRAEAQEIALQAAEVARISAILSAFVLASAALVAAAAAYIGAVRGGRHRDEGRIFGGFAYRV